MHNGLPCILELLCIHVGLLIEMTKQFEKLLFSTMENQNQNMNQKIKVKIASNMYRAIGYFEVCEEKNCLHSEI